MADPQKIQNLKLKLLDALNDEYKGTEFYDSLHDALVDAGFIRLSDEIADIGDNEAEHAEKIKKALEEISEAGTTGETTHAADSLYKWADTWNRMDPSERISLMRQHTLDEELISSVAGTSWKNLIQSEKFALKVMFDIVEGEGRIKSSTPGNTIGSKNILREIAGDMRRALEQRGTFFEGAWAKEARSRAQGIAQSLEQHEYNGYKKKYPTLFESMYVESHKWSRQDVANIQEDIRDIFKEEREESKPTTPSVSSRLDVTGAMRMAQGGGTGYLDTMMRLSSANTADDVFKIMDEARPKFISGEITVQQWHEIDREREKQLKKFGY